MASKTATKLEGVLAEFSQLRLARVRGQITALRVLRDSGKAEVADWEDWQINRSMQGLGLLYQHALWFEDDRLPNMLRYLRDEIHWSSVKDAGRGHMKIYWDQYMHELIDWPYEQVERTSVTDGFEAWSAWWAEYCNEQAQRLQDLRFPGGGQYGSHKNLNTAEVLIYAKKDGYEMQDGQKGKKRVISVMRHCMLRDAQAYAGMNPLVEDEK